MTCNGSQLFGAWSIEPSHFRRIVGVVNGLRMSDILELHRQAEPEEAGGDGGDGGGGVRVTDRGTAIISIGGPLTKGRTSFQELLGGTSMLETRRQIRMAVADPDVKTIMLHIDSPGGTVAGTHDLGDEVAAAAAQKPTWAYIEDLGASAAYAVAVRASKVFANRTAMVGSIGTIMVLQDTSKIADEIGVKVHVISTGFMKGAGEPGTEITDEQLEGFQAMIDSLFGQFRRDVMQGRGLNRAKFDEIATGAVWIGQEAADLGLIDGVQSVDRTLSQLARQPRIRSKAETRSRVATARMATVVER